MAEVKWIKLATDIFDNRKIRQIESMPDGDSIIVIWLKLLCLAGTVNDNGLIYLTRDVPYTEDMLSSQFSRPLSTVRLALMTFERFGMIEIVNDFLLLPSWEKYQNIEGLDRVREQTKRRVFQYRERQRSLMSGNLCQYCGAPATGYDHVIATARGGTDSPDNKIPCCKECNQIKNDKPLVDFLNNNRDRIKDEIVCNNSILSRFVSLSNVTNRYTVTLGNATEEEGDIDKEREKEKEKEKYKEKETRRFAPPTLQEVQEYCLSRRNGVDPQQFVDFYTAKGWKIGKDTMKDWKAAVRTWEGRNGTRRPPATSKPKTTVNISDLIEDPPGSGKYRPKEETD